ncbi:MAG: hypothetical protein ATN32_08855 [Candidatus Epulonipiscium fishelsonii]|nr:MAG: hypothetical protein ATN32_08855 [Epulopiscium sp. AS2M-Bin002]
MRKTIYLKERQSRRKQQQRQRMIIVIVGIIGVLIIGMSVLWPNYYEVVINGQDIGTIENKEYVEDSLNFVKTQLELQYKTSVKLSDEDNIEVKKTLFPLSDRINTEYLISYIRNNMDFLLEFYEIRVDGENIGIVQSKDYKELLLDELNKEFYNNSATDFKNNIEFIPVFARREDLMSIENLIKIATKTSKVPMEYIVEPADTLGGIANKLKISLQELLNYNPHLTPESTITVGEKLKVEVDMPFIKLR